MCTGTGTSFQPGVVPGRVASNTGGIKSKPQGRTTGGSGGSTKSVLRKADWTGEPGADNGVRFGTVELTFSPETDYLARPAVTMHHGDHRG